MQGELAVYAEQMQKEYIRVLCENDAEFKEDYENALKEIENKTLEIKAKLERGLQMNGFVKVEEILSAPDFKEALSKSRHSNFLMPLQNSFDKRGRTFKAGEIYFADLNPVLADELGGERPVIVLVHNKSDKTVLCVPCSSKLTKNGMLELKKEDYNLIYDSQVCIKQIRTISSTRLYDKIGELKKEDLKIIKKNIVERLGIDKYLLQEILDERIETAISESDFVETESVKTQVEPQQSIDHSETYELTKEEIGQIVMAKIQHMQDNGSRLQFSKDYKIEGEDLSKGIFVKLNAMDAYNNIFYTDIFLYPFYAHYYCGDKKQLNDCVLQEALVKLLSKKYTTYPKKYARAIADAYSKKYNNARSQSGQINAEKGFAKSLSFIGKYMNNCDDIMREGAKALNFYDLADITESV